MPEEQLQFELPVENMSAEEITSILEIPGLQIEIRGKIFTCSGDPEKIDQLLNAVAALGLKETSDFP